jgi:integrase
VDFNINVVPGPLMVPEGKMGTHQLVLFVTWLASKKDLAYKTIKVYLSGVRFYHISNGHKDPITGKELLRLHVRGIRKLSKSTRRYMFPLTVADLRHAKALCFDMLGSSSNQRCVWAATMLAFFGLLRVSEYAAASAGKFDPLQQLTLGDITFKVEKGLEYVVVHIKRSKTDVFREGTTIAVGATGGPLCPVAALKAMLRDRRSSQQHPSSPLFVYRNKPLTRRTMEATVKGIARRVGKGADPINTHSLRRGGASALFANGFTKHQIMVLGRWSSNALNLYLVPAAHMRAQAAARMAQDLPQQHHQAHYSDWGARSL